MSLSDKKSAAVEQQASRDSFSQKVVKAVGITLALVLLVYLLGAIFNVLLLIMAGVLLAVFLRGTARTWSKRLPLSEGWTTVLVALLTLGVLVAIGWLLAPKLNEQLNNLSQELPKALERLKAQLSQNALLERALNNLSLEGGPPTGKETWLHKGLGFLSTTFGVLADIYVILFLGIFFSAQPQLYKKGMVYLFPIPKRARAREVVDTLANTLYNWLIGKAISMLIVAVFTAIGLWLLGIPLAFVLALIAGLFSFVPNFGPLFALIPAVGVGLMQGPNQALYVVILYMSIQVVESNLITPLVQKKMIQLPPALIIIAQLILGVFSGVLGLILATPIIALVMVLVKMVYVQDILGDESIDVQAKD